MQQTNFLALPLQGCDIVLGIQWLKTLGPIVWDFQALTMQFKVNGRQVILHGLQWGAIFMATKKQVSKMNYTSGKSLYSLVLTKQPPLQVGNDTFTQPLDAVAH